MKKETIIILIVLIVTSALAWLFLFSKNDKIEVDQTLKIVTLGDSLTEGYGVEEEDNYPSQLEKKLIGDGLEVEIINKGVSGDTTEDTLMRIDEIVDIEPDIVILAIGSNDALRALSVEKAKKNIINIIEKLEEHNVKILFCGMRLPPVRGFKYSREFKEMFIKISEDYDVVFMPYFLGDVAIRADLNIDDGIHPNKEGYTVIVDNLYPYFKKLIKKYY